MKSGFFALSIVAGAALLLAGSPAGKSAVVWPTADLKWVDLPGLPGARISVLWGDPKTGAYGAFKKIPAGGKLALHTHSHDQKVIAISGTIALAIQGGESKDLSTGAYSFLPAGVVHSAECKGTTECVYFEEQDGASDIKFVESAPAAAAPARKY